MGIDFSHCEAHWSYSGFSEFRNRLTAKIGIVLEEMKGFGGELKWDTVNDDIKPLLNHSDCDGELTVEECKIVAPRLQELIKGWSDDDYDKRHALELIEGMIMAIAAGEPLRFC